jgi:hypothetical protein
MNNKKVLYLVGVFLLIVIIGMLFPGSSYASKMTKEGLRGKEGATDYVDCAKKNTKDKCGANPKKCKWDKTKCVNK